MRWHVAMLRLLLLLLLWRRRRQRRRRRGRRLGLGLGFLHHLRRLAACPRAAPLARRRAHSTGRRHGRSGALPTRSSDAADRGTAALECLSVFATSARRVRVPWG